MIFRVISNSSHTPSTGQNITYLWTDNWNDWGEFQTLFVLTYFDENGEKHDLGGVKIGQFDMEPKQSRPDIPASFEELGDRFFSLGQDSDYYSTAMSLGEERAKAILSALHDISLDAELYTQALEEKVTGTSLLRNVDTRTIEGQFRRILDGGAILTPFSFHYSGQTPKVPGADPLKIGFEITPDSKPPTNIQVLIGRNGVGKTHLLNSMTRALLEPGEDAELDGQFISRDEFGQESEGLPFSNAVSVTFSAFDDFEIVRQGRNASKGTRYTHIGLRKRVKDKNENFVTITRSPEDLAKDFSESAKICARGARAIRWKRALSTLEADPLFAEANVSGLVDIDLDNFGREAGKLYRRLSSGHKIVLLTITKLVESVQEKTLVLMDEPEAHLHPPLLSAFIRALSDLLINRNGVALIATHSPVVLQEVPKSCAWKIFRHGYVSTAERPAFETFAENVGTLTREVFGFEVTRSGFHRMLAEAVEDDPDFAGVIDLFENKIGSEGRAILRSLVAEQGDGGQD